jgi:hypothetical protein
MYSRTGIQHILFKLRAMLMPRSVGVEGAVPGDQGGDPVGEGANVDAVKPGGRRASIQWAAMSFRLRQRRSEW